MDALAQAQGQGVQTQGYSTYIAYALVAIAVLTAISITVKKLIDSDDEGQKKIGKQLAISFGVLCIIVLFIVGYMAMPQEKRNIANFLIEFFPYILLFAGMGGLLYLVSPDSNITEDLKDIQKRMGVVAGVGTVGIAITALLAFSMIRIDPSNVFFPFTLTMIFMNLEIALLSFLCIFYGKV